MTDFFLIIGFFVWIAIAITLCSDKDTKFFSDSLRERVARLEVKVEHLEKKIYE